MKNFQNILVGVDLSQSLRTGAATFRPPVEQAIKEAIWAAKLSKARLTFFAAIDVPRQDVYFSGEELDDLSDRLHAAGAKALDGLTARATAEGVQASSRISAGTGWVEVIRQVLRYHHDLVVVGARNIGAVERFLFGSTTMKLLQNCPCPVWITHPEPRDCPKNILVASDLSAVTDESLALAAGIAREAGARLNLLTAVDCPLDRLWSAALSDFNTKAYHQRMIADARKALEKQADRVLPDRSGLDLHLHVTESVVIADIAITRFIEEQGIDLLAMGTMARSGIPGVFIGNTAERLSTSVQCSLLAVKPPDFVCPIGLPPSGGELAQPVI